MIISFEMTEPDDDPIVMLAETVMRFIFQYGAPKEIRVTNVIVEAGLEQICDVCGIKLRRVKRLHGLYPLCRAWGGLVCRLYGDESFLYTLNRSRD